MKNQKGFANLLIIILGLLVVGSGGYLYVSQSNTEESPLLEKESLGDGGGEYVWTKKYKLGDSFESDKIIYGVVYFHNNQYVLMHVAGDDSSNMYLINQKTGENLLSGEYVIRGFDLTGEGYKYLEEGFIIISSFKAMDYGFSGILIIDINNNTFDKIVLDDTIDEPVTYDKYGIMDSRFVGLNTDLFNTYVRLIESGQYISE